MSLDGGTTRKVKPLTERQEEVLRFILSWMQANSSPPTITEIANHLGIPYPKSAGTHLEALEKKGYIQRIPGKARGIRLTAKSSSFQDETISSEWLTVPRVGRVRAGVATGSDHLSDGQITIPSSFLSERPDFVLTVIGDSMIGAGIYDGDLAFIKKGGNVSNGDIIVAQIQGEMTLKTYLHHNGRLLLRAANPSYPDRIILPDDEADLVQGRLIGIFRSLSRNGGRN
ncbi:transcriptional repressor LexA [Leptospirillum ferrooxidans]|jgi:repressor LexA|uniref:LexA repressor n=1 Tax=Leptospirillum ferrooxidans (strain C2-3) TaxID=1162668 RepID=I0IQ17_LEPFC|nr:transcriptional repressor LexA [Leptospirillum ferrooxidans]BAM07366.1 putative LexA repressor [Leptospirillum ferrooxidans C2-3]